MNRTESVIRQSLVCPACRGALSDVGRGLACKTCARSYPVVAGLLDLRLVSDRYLDLEAERAKAERLRVLAETTDIMGLATAYYALTEDEDRRGARFLQHIAGAAARGEALATRLPRGGQVLEIGCGTGGLLVAAARAGIAITGVDVAARWLVAARRRLADDRLSVPLLAATAEQLPWPDGQFDTVVADSVLEHLDEPVAALREWLRVLRPGGRLIVWSPNRFMLTTDPHLGLWGLGWLPRRWLPAYLRLRGRRAWPPRTLSATAAAHLVAAAGFGAVTADVPAIPECWARTRPWLEQSAIQAYNAARGLPVMRRLVRSIGPLWELQALARPVAPWRSAA
jgi:ubiquinone/menaquinone biosynthesis C-methylase UbiE